MTGELKADGLKWYQELIRNLRWAVEICRIDILLEVSILSTRLAPPQEGHLEHVLHLSGYLNIHKKMRLLLDCSYPRINLSSSINRSGLIYRGVQRRIFLLILLNQGYMKSPFLCLLMLTLQGTITPGAARQRY